MPAKKAKPSIEERRDQVKERLLDLAEYISIEQGYDRFSLRELARQAGVAAPSLYEYFPNKDAIMQAVGNRMSATLSAAMLRAYKRSTDPKQRLITMSLAYIRTALRNPETFRLLSNLSSSSDLPQTSLPVSPFELLRLAIVDLVGPSASREVLNSLSYGFWALVHGMVMLQLTDMPSSEFNFSPAQRISITQLVEGLSSLNNRSPHGQP